MVFRAAEKIEIELMDTYLTKLYCLNNVKSADPSKATDLQALCDNLMRQMHWRKPSDKAIDLYAVKKHMMEVPSLKETCLVQLPKNDFENLKESQWAK